ncbi:MAG: DUF2341 domain-containing protein, partial [Thermoplasmata archaeon]
LTQDAPIRGIVSADFDNDGWKDIASLDIAGKIWLWENPRNLSQTWILADIIKLNMNASNDASRPITIGDYDLDGDIDIICGLEGGCIAYLNNTLQHRNALFDTNRILANMTGSGKMSIAYGDVDLDGDVDIVVGFFCNTKVAVGLFENPDDGTVNPFSSNWRMSVTPFNILTSFNFRVLLADLNRDNLLDLILAFDNGRIYAVKAEDKGKWVNPVAINNPLYQIYSIVCTDLDRDGYPDIVIGAKNNDTIYGLKNPGGSDPFIFWLEAFAIVPSSEGKNTSIQVADIDKDGYPDIISSNSSCTSPPKNRIYIWKNPGSDCLSSKKPWNEPYSFIMVNNTSAPINLLKVVDIDNDGDIDILAGLNSSETQIGEVRSSLNISFNPGENPFSTSWTSKTLLSERLPDIISLETADFDNDGDEDILVGNYAGEIEWLINNGITESGVPSFKDFLQKIDSLSQYGIASVFAVNLDRKGTDEDNFTLDNGDFDIGILAFPTGWQQSQHILKIYRNNGAQVTAVATDGNNTVQWHDARWAYRKTIVVNSSLVEDNLTNFPVLVQLVNDTDLSTHARPDGKDILFTSSDGTPLHFEIENYTKTSNGSNLTCWVKLPNVSSQSDTLFYMYYGNPNASGGNNATQTWDSSYVGVWHLDEVPDAGNSIFKDSTSNQNNGTGIGLTSDNNTLGRIDRCIEFNGENQFITVNSSESLNFSGNSITVSAWVWKLQQAQSQDNYPLGKSDGSLTQGYWLFLNSNEIFFGIGNGSNVSVATPFSFNSQWKYITATYNGTYLSIYIDGKLKNNVSCTGNIQTTVSSLCFGSSSFNSNYFKGRLDEIRIQKDAKNASWIKTEFNNVNSINSFLRIGPEIPIPRTLPGNFHPLILVNFSHNGMKADNSSRVEKMTFGFKYANNNNYMPRQVILQYFTNFSLYYSEDAVFEPATDIPLILESTVIHPGGVTLNVLQNESYASFEYTRSAYIFFVCTINASAPPFYVIYDPDGYNSSTFWNSVQNMSGNRTLSLTPVEQYQTSAIVVPELFRPVVASAVAITLCIVINLKQRFTKKSKKESGNKLNRI